MSDIQVTRRDREMACDAADPGWRESLASGDEEAGAELTAWLDTGSVPGKAAGDEALEELQRLARGYAQARAEGVASERERWLAEADRAEAWFDQRSYEDGAVRHSGDCLIPQFLEGREDAWESSALRMREMKATMTKEPGNV